MTNAQQIEGVWRHCLFNEPACERVGRGLHLMADGRLRLVSNVYADSSVDEAYCTDSKESRGQWRVEDGQFVLGRRHRETWQLVEDDMVVIHRNGFVDRMRRVSEALGLGPCRTVDAACEQNAECYGNWCNEGRCASVESCEPPEFGWPGERVEADPGGGASSQ